MSQALDIEHLAFRIGETQILDDVSLSVESGEYVSVIGPNGAGKTTLLKCIMRILRPSGGTIRIAGRDAAEYSQRELAGIVGYVPQADGRRTPFTVREFVLMGRYPHLSPFTAVGPGDRDAARQAMEVTDTNGFAERRMHTLSGGECQKVFIAAALAQDARVLLLDEPTTFLDPHHQADIFAILKRINRDQGVTILSVTHDVNSAALSSNRIFALREGATAFCGAPRDLMDNRVLRDLYGKEFLFVDHPRTGDRLVVPEGTA